MATTAAKPTSSEPNQDSSDLTAPAQQAELGSTPDSEATPAPAKRSGFPWLLTLTCLNLLLVAALAAAGWYFWQQNQQSWTQAQLVENQLQAELRSQAQGIASLNSNLAALSVNYSNVSSAQAERDSQLRALGERLSAVRPLADTAVWQIGQLIYLADRERLLEGDPEIILQLLQRALQYLPLEAIGSASLRQALALDIANYSQPAINGRRLWLNQLRALQERALELELSYEAPTYALDLNSEANQSDLLDLNSSIAKLWLRLQSLVKIERGDPSLPLLLNQTQRASVKLILLTNLNQAALALNANDSSSSSAYLQASLRLLESYAPGNEAVEQLHEQIGALEQQTLTPLPTLNSLSSFALWSQAQ